MNKKKSISYYSLEKTKTICNTLYGLKISTNRKITITPYHFENLCITRRTPVNRFPTQNSTRTYPLDHTYYRLHFCPIKSSQPRNLPFPSTRTLLQLGNSSFPSSLSPPIRIAAKVYRWRLAYRWTTLKEIFTRNVERKRKRERDRGASARRPHYSFERGVARAHTRSKRKGEWKGAFSVRRRVMRPVTESYLTCGYDGLPTRLLLWNS